MVALFWLQVVLVVLNIVPTWISDSYGVFRSRPLCLVTTSFEVLDLLSGRIFPLLGKDFVGEFSHHDLNIRSRHGFVMFSVFLGHDLSDWSRPPLGSMNNK